MSQIIHVHRGTVDKYIGDAVMAFWGAPIDDPEHAAHAVKAAQSMLQEVVRLNDEFSKRGWPQLQIGIGINSGVVRVGDMGSTQRRAYTVIGDAVNMAARFEALTKELKLPLVVGQRTQVLAGADQFTALGLKKIAGKNELVEVYCLTQLMAPPVMQEPLRVVSDIESNAERAL
jgi:adenylate cyclase